MPGGDNVNWKTILVAGGAMIGTFALVRLAQGKPPLPPVEDFPFIGDGVSDPIRRFDTNNNDIIDDEELFAAEQAFDRGEISEETLFAIVDLWVKQDPISSLGV